MRIGFYGNCQCLAIQSLFSQSAFKSWFEVVALPPVFQCEHHMLEEVRKRISSTDVLFAQFVSDRYGNFSTQEISPHVAGKMFLIPNLRCKGYSPQSDYLPDDGTLTRMEYTDFRVLELYLKGYSASEAQARYYDAETDEARVKEIFLTEIAKQRNLFRQGLISFDYAERLEKRYSEQLLFWTHNHPVKTEIEWLINSILRFLGRNVVLSVNEEVLGSYHPPYLKNVLSKISPSLEILSPIIVKGRTLGIDDYVAGFYEDFREHDKKSLISAYENSLWVGLASGHSLRNPRTSFSPNHNRKQIAEFWLNTPSDQLENAYHNEPGNSHRKLMEGNLRNEALSEEEKLFFQQLGSELTRRSSVDPVSAMNYLLAIMLYLPSGRLKIENAEKSLPTWLIADYMKYFSAMG